MHDAARGDRSSVFGDLLRRHRLAANLTQEALATRSRLSLDAISLLERGLRTAPRTSTVALLADALGLDPVDRRQFVAAARYLSPEQRPPRPLTSFVGRSRELEELAVIVASTPLVTIMGAAGCGKSRLAAELAGRIGHGFTDGVALVDLAPILDGAIVADHIAAALGAGRRSERAIVRLVADANLLLVLDNAEHLLHTVIALLREPLARCPNLRVLTTSREPLNVPGEQRWDLRPLGLPPSAAVNDLETIADSDAVELFVSRVKDDRRDFRLTAGNAGLVASICRRVDGIPLALELAATRAGTLGLTGLAGRLDDALALLTRGSHAGPAHHRTMRATLDWSYELLDSSERVLLRRLSAFMGTFDLAAVEAVCASSELPPRQLPDALHGLVMKSLVVSVPLTEDRMRYRQLEIVRQYGGELLRLADEPGVRRRHADHYLGKALRLGTKDADLTVRAAALAPDHDNLRLALAWVATSDPERYAEVVESLRWFWELRGSVMEAREHILAALANAHTSGTRRARLHLQAAVWLRQGRHLAAAFTHLETAESLASAASDPSTLARTLIMRGILRNDGGDRSGAEQDLQRAIGIMGDGPLTPVMVAALINLANVEIAAGRVYEARRHADKAVAAFTMLHPQFSATPETMHTLGVVLLATGQPEQARVRFLDSLALCAGHNNIGCAVGVLQGLACVAGARGQAARSLTLLAAARRFEELVGPDPPPPMSPITAHVDAERSSRRALGRAAARAAWTLGRSMDLEAALGFARTEE